MPVFDIYAVARSAGRFLLYIGLIGYIVSVGYIIFNILESFSLLVNTSIENFDSLFNNVSGSGNSVLGCLGYLLSGLGIDVVLTSFFASAVSLLMMYAGALITLYSIAFAFVIKKTVIKAIR